MGRAVLHPVQLEQGDLLVHVVLRQDGRVGKPDCRGHTRAGGRETEHGLRLSELDLLTVQSPVPGHAAPRMDPGLLWLSRHTGLAGRQAQHVEASVSVNVQEGQARPRTQVDGIDRLERPAVRVRIADQIPLHDQVRDAAAVHVHHTQAPQVQRGYGDGPVSHEGGQAHRGPVTSVQEEGDLSGAPLSEDQIHEPVAVHVNEVRVHVRAGEVLELGGPTLLHVLQPHHIAEGEVIVRTHARVAHHTAYGGPGPVVVVPGARQIRSAVSGEVQQAHGVHGHGARFTSVPPQQVADADHGDVGLWRQRRADGSGGKADLVLAVARIDDDPFDSAAVAVCEILCEGVVDDRSVRRIDHLYGVGIQDPRPPCRGDELPEIDGRRHGDVAQVAGELRGDGEANGPGALCRCAHVILIRCHAPMMVQSACGYFAKPRSRVMSRQPARRAKAAR